MRYFTKSELVAFSGIDGAGKSTQIERLKKYYIQKDIKHKVIWSRGGYTPGFEILKKVIRFLGRSSIPQSGYSDKREKAFNNRFISTMWLAVAITDLIILYSIVMSLYRLIGYKVICDRYLIDTEIDFQLNFENINVQKSFVWRLVKMLTPNPNYHFLATLSVEESVIRCRQKYEPYPDSRERLAIRLSLYETYLKENKKVVHIDGSKSPDDIEYSILNIMA